MRRNITYFWPSPYHLIESLNNAPREVLFYIFNLHGFFLWKTGFLQASDVMLGDFQGSAWGLDPYRGASLEDVQRGTCFLGGADIELWRGLNFPINSCI